jgi:chromate transporter
MLILNLLNLLITFFLIGLLTFGGGYAMIPLIKEEVLTNAWMSEALLLDFVAIAKMSPGTFAINIATFIGYQQHLVLGSIFAVVGVMLPSIIIIITIAKVFHHFADNKYVIGFLSGAKPVIVGVILSVGIGFALTSVFNMSGIRDFDNFNFDWRTLSILVVVFVINKIKPKMHPAVIILISAAMSYVFFGIL